MKPSGRQLFNSSEDEESGDKEDGRRFDIRPEFQGQAGQKVRFHLLLDPPLIFSSQHLMQIQPFLSASARALNVA